MRGCAVLSLVGSAFARNVLPLPPIVTELQEALGIQVTPGQDAPGRFPFGFNIKPAAPEPEMAGQQAEADGNMGDQYTGEMNYDVNERGQFRSPAAFAAAITNQSGLPGPFADTFAEVTAQGSQTLVELNKSMMRWLETIGEQMFDPIQAYAPIERGIEAAAAAAPDANLAATLPVLGNLLRLLAVPLQGVTDSFQTVTVAGPIAEMESMNRVIEHISPVELRTEEQELIPANAE